MTVAHLHPDPYSDNPDEDTSLPCAGKLAFDTRRLAAVSANVAQYQHGASVRPYRCRYCDLWHLASL